MLKIVQATCNNGELILNEKLSEELEGKNLQIMIFESVTSAEKSLESQTDSTELQINHFLQDLQKYSFKLESGYKFNREEIYDR